MINLFAVPALYWKGTVENLYDLVINIQQIPEDCDLNHMQFNSTTLGQEVTNAMLKKNYLLLNTTCNAIFSFVSLVSLLFMDL